MSKYVISFMQTALISIAAFIIIGFITVVVVVAVAELSSP